MTARDELDDLRTEHAALAARGLALTPTGATFPGGIDPNDRNIRLAPTRPALDDVREAMAVVCLCIRLASAEHEASTADA